MKYVLLLIFCALVFLVCFLVDQLLQKLFPKHELEKSKSVVRPPQKSATFGVLLVFIPLMALLFWMPEGGDALLTGLLRRRDDHGRVPTLHIFFRRDLLWGRQLSL